jgi:hypothetical protein
MDIDKAKIYEAVEKQFPDPAFSTEVSTLTRDVIKLSMSWLEKYDDENKSRRELQKDLKIYLKKQLVFDDPNKPYYFPAFIWIMVAQAVISFIVKYIINNYSRSRR